MNFQKANLTEGYEVPRIIIGAWQLSEGHNVCPAAAEDAINTLSEFADAGFSTFDCADIYTGVEELIGKFLRLYLAASDSDARRVQIHTKFVPDRDVLGTISKTYTESIINRSLERLGVEQLDMVQFSWWDYRIPGYVEVARWLHELQSDGKIKHLGVTNFDVQRLSEILDAGVPVVSNQVQYSLLDHRPESGMVDLCRERGIHLLCYGTLAGGFLSDRWLDKSDPAESLPNRSLTKYRLMINEFGGWYAFQDLLKVLGEIASRYEVSIGNVATRYVLDRPQVASAIVGAHSTEHLKEMERVASLDIEHNDIEMLREFAVNRSATGDVFGLERDPDGVHAGIMRYNLNRE